MLILLTVVAVLARWVWFWFFVLFSLLVSISLWLRKEIRESDRAIEEPLIKRLQNGSTTELAWLLSCALILVSYAITFGLENVLTNNIGYSYYYLLSSINQSLATLFALIFALMFTIVQLSHNGDKKNLGKYFTNIVLFYILLFVVSILLPLFLMGTENRIYLQCMLFLASVCVLLLIPFFWRFKIKASMLNAPSVTVPKVVRKRKSTRR